MSDVPVVVVHVLGALRSYVGGAARLTVPARTVREALAALERSHPPLYQNVCDETGSVRRHLNIFVNADNVRDLDGIDSTLKSGDVLAVLPAVSGG